LPHLTLRLIIGDAISGIHVEPGLQAIRCANLPPGEWWRTLAWG